MLLSFVRVYTGPISRGVTQFPNDKYVRRNHTGVICMKCMHSGGMAFVIFVDLSENGQCLFEFLSRCFVQIYRV